MDSESMKHACSNPDVRYFRGALNKRAMELKPGEVAAFLAGAIALAHTVKGGAEAFLDGFIRCSSCLASVGPGRQDDTASSAGKTGGEAT